MPEKDKEAFGLSRQELLSKLVMLQTSLSIKSKILQEFEEHSDFYSIPLKLRYEYGLFGIYTGLAFGHNHELFEREYDYNNPRHYDHSTLVDIFNKIKALGWYTK